MSEKNTLEASLDAYDGYVQTLDDYAEMIEFAENENDEAMLAELQTNLDNLQKSVKHAELEALLSGEADGNDTYLEVHAGSGGTEAMDWAQMLLRMYIRFWEWVKGGLAVKQEHQQITYEIYSLWKIEQLHQIIQNNY